MISLGKDTQRRSSNLEERQKFAGRGKDLFLTKGTDKWKKCPNIGLSTSTCLYLGMSFCVRRSDILHPDKSVQQTYRRTNKQQLHITAVDEFSIHPFFLPLSSSGLTGLAGYHPDKRLAPDRTFRKFRIT